jgi:hypothetical protein
MSIKGGIDFCLKKWYSHVIYVRLRYVRVYYSHLVNLSAASKARFGRQCRDTIRGALSRHL